MDEMNQTPTPRFRSQWRPDLQPSWAQRNDKPTCTVPDQSMTIPEIIAKFTRTGLVPRAFAQRDQGGNVAMDPDFDPLDDYTETLAEASRLRKSADGLRDPSDGQDKGAEGDREAGSPGTPGTPETPAT